MDLSTPMNSRHRTILLVLVCTGIFATGYYVGGKRSESLRGRDRLLRPAHSTDTAAAGDTAELKGSELSRLIEGLSDYRKQQRLYIYAERLTAAEMAGALNDALHLPLSQRNAALAVLLGRWSELDPEAATRYASELPNSADPQKLRDRALAVWAGKDFDAALAWSLKQQSGDARNRCLTELARVVAQSSPTQAMGFVKAHFKPADIGMALSRVFSVWAERDFEAAFAAAQAAEPKLRSNLLLTTLETQVEKSPRRVLEAIFALQHTDSSSSLLRSSLESWVKRDTVAALQWVSDQPPGSLRSTAVYFCASAAARQDAESALDWVVNKLQGSEQNTAIRAAFWTLSERDPDQALARAQTFADGHARETALGALGSVLGRSDPQRGLQILANLPDGDIRRDSTGTLCNLWAQSEPAAAAQWLVDHTSLTEQPHALRQIIDDWDRSDPMGALAWAESLASSEQKSQTFNQLLYDLARAKPDLARERFASLDVETQRASSERMANGWALNDSAASMEWANAIPDGEARTNAVKGVISVWGFQEPSAAAKWIDALPAGPDRDAATQTFATATVYKDPQGSVAWALTIGEESRRKECLRKVITSWLERDKAAALTWLQADTSVPGDLKVDLQGVGGR